MTENNRHPGPPEEKSPGVGTAKILRLSQSGANSSRAETARRPCCRENMKRSSSKPADRQRVLVLVDESNVTSSAKVSNRKLDWLKLRDFLVGERQLVEMVVYAGLPPAMPEWQAERDKKNKFLHWLRSHGFLVMTQDGSPGAETHYKSNVDVLMAVDAVELSMAAKPDVVVLVTGDADFAHLAIQLRRRGIRIEAASTLQTLGAGLKSAVNAVVDLAPLLETFEQLV